MIEHETQVRVRYGETDQMGYLYYGKYALYYEIGRVELIRDLGLTYKILEEEHGILMPVVAMDTRFVRPARYDELLTVKTSLRKMPGQYITFHHEIYNEQGKLVNGGNVRLCFIDSKTNKRIPAPEYLTQKLLEIF